MHARAELRAAHLARDILLLRSWGLHLVIPDDLRPVLTATSAAVLVDGLAADAELTSQCCLRDARDGRLAGLGEAIARYGRIFAPGGPNGRPSPAREWIRATRIRCGSRRR